MSLFLVNVDLGGNQLQNFAVEVLTDDPTGADLYEGRLWFNDTVDTLKYYNGAVVVPLSTAGDIDSLTVDDASIENIGTAVNPSIRVKALGIVSGMLSNAISRSKFTAPTGDIAWGGFKITGLADPTAAQDAATRAYVLAQIAALVDTSPATLDTLNELAAALGDDPNFATTIATQIGALDTRLDVLEAAPPLARKVVADIGDGVSTSIDVTHGLNNFAVMVQVWEIATKEQVFADVVLTSLNVAQITFNIAPNTNQYRVVVVG